MKWRIKDTLFVLVLGIVGAAVSIAVSAFREHYPLDLWLSYYPYERLSWAAIGLIAGTGLGLASRGATDVDGTLF